MTTQDLVERFLDEALQTEEEIREVLTAVPDDQWALYRTLVSVRLNDYKNTQFLTAPEVGPGEMRDAPALTSAMQQRYEVLHRKERLFGDEERRRRTAL